MSELLLKNMQIISKRWPPIAAILSQRTFEHLETNLVRGNEQTIRVNGIQLSSCYDRVGEAKLLIGNTDLTKKRVAVYGVGMGDVPTELLFTDVEIIHVYPLNYALFAMLLNFTDQTQWLQNKKVTLVFDTNFLDVKRTRITIAPDLELADDAHAAMRDVLVHENVLPFINQQHGKKHGENLQRFKDNASFIENIPDARLLIKERKHEHIYVIGAGPTLEEHYDFLKNQSLMKDRPLLVAVDTAYMALASNGIIPDIVVSIDSLISMKYFPDNVDEKTALVCFPTVTTNLLDNWPGPKYMAYSQLSLFDDLNEENKKIRLFSSGSVIHPAVDLAVLLGAKELTLFGADFCFPDNKTHAHWKEGALNTTVTSKNPHWVFNSRGEKVVTNLNFRGYLRSLEAYISQTSQVCYFQTSLKGAKINGAKYKECI
ncbi:motility associated factor glycosyltransferase family protein [Shewanella japonica]|uniref:motility associated factor glycosyltransferase family protein n=1 Tax=Shewanella japonica TaxID=93973 RepID=UPI0024949E8D|nr:6-hydroxymethylpterin diphosphokinase MptE-like protein [Shewanella japonica]